MDNMISRRTQLQNIYRHLMDGQTLTRLIALDLFGCQSLTPRITELRQLGIKFSHYRNYKGTTVYLMDFMERSYNARYFYEEEVTAKRLRKHKRNVA